MFIYKCTNLLRDKGSIYIFQKLIKAQASFQKPSWAMVAQIFYIHISLVILNQQSNALISTLNLFLWIPKISSNSDLTNIGLFDPIRYLSDKSFHSNFIFLSSVKLSKRALMIFIEKSLWKKNHSTFMQQSLFCTKVF